MNNTKRNLLISFGMWLVFEGIAITLWITKDNIFYLLNFSYIGNIDSHWGINIVSGLIIRHARRIVQLLVGMYMLVYLWTDMSGKYADRRFFVLSVYRSF